MLRTCHPQVCNLNPSETSVCRLGNGGPFAGFGNADLTFAPPSNIRMMNSVTTDMAAGLKSESISTTRAPAYNPSTESQIPRASPVARAQFPAPPVFWCCNAAIRTSGRQNLRHSFADATCWSVHTDDEPRRPECSERVPARMEAIPFMLHAAQLLVECAHAIRGGFSMLYAPLPPPQRGPAAAASGGSRLHQETHRDRGSIEDCHNEIGLHERDASSAS